jgi:hypothetical protein
MADNPLDSSVNQPGPPKPDASTHRHDSFKDRQAQAQQSAGAKLQEAALSTDSRPQAAKPASNDQLMIPGLQSLGELANHALQPLQKLRTDAVLSATHMSTDDIANQLPSKLISDLAQGKYWQGQNLANLSPAQQRQIDVYEQYKNRYLNDGLGSNAVAAVALDRGTMLDELNQSIAKRFKSEHPDQAAALERPNGQRSEAAAKAEKADRTVTASQFGSDQQHAPHLDRAPEMRQPAADAKRTTEAQRQMPQDHPASHPATDARSGQPSHQSQADVHSDAAPKTQRTAAPNPSEIAGAGRTRATAQPQSSESRASQQTSRAMSEPLSIEAARTDANQRQVHSLTDSDRGSPRLGAAAIDSRHAEQNALRAGGSQLPLRSGAPESGVPGKGLPSQPYPLGDSRSVSMRPEEAKSLAQNHAVNEHPGAGRQQSDLSSSATNRTNSPAHRDGALGSSDRGANATSARAKADTHSAESQGKTQQSSTANPLATRAGEVVRQTKNGPQIAAAALSKLQIVGETKNLAAPSIRAVGSGEQGFTMRGAVQKIESARELIQNANHATPYIMRPLALSLPGVAGRDGAKVLVSVRSSLVSSQQATRRVLADVAGASAANGKDGSAVKATTFTPRAAMDASRRVGPGTSVRGAKLDTDASQTRRGSGEGTHPESGKSPYITTFRTNGETKRYVLGTEIALTLILASAGIQRVRAEQNRPPRADAVTSHSGEQGRRDGIKLTAQDRAAERLSGIKLSTKVESGPLGASRRTDGATTKDSTLKGDARTGNLTSRVNGSIDVRGVKDGAGARSVGFRLDGSREPLGIQPGLSVRHEQSSRRTIQQNDNAGSNQRHTFGVEISLTMILASGGISRIRSEKANAGKLEQGTGKNELPVRTDNSANLHEPLKQGKPDLLSTQRPLEQKTDAFLSRLREQLKLPESLRTQYDELTRRLTARPIPVYIAAHDNSSVAAWHNQPLPQIEVFGAEAGEERPGFFGRKDVPGYRFNRSNHDLGLNEADQSIRAESELSDSAEEADEHKPVDEGLHAIQRPTVLVAVNDTLTSIAETFFHDANIAWLLLDLNRNSVKQTEVDGMTVVQLVTRQKLMLPVWDPDITDFYADRREEKQIENLITIVEETQLDKELMSSILGNVISEKKQNDTKSSAKDDDFQLVEAQAKRAPEGA